MEVLRPKKYFKKPEVVEAVQVKRENIEAIAEWCNGVARTVPVREGVYVPTSPNSAIELFHVRLGLYLIKEADGTYRVLDSDMFERLYEAVE